MHILYSCHISGAIDQKYAATDAILRHEDYSIKVKIGELVLSPK